MDILGQKVTHTSFGTGTVTEQTGSTLTVRFADVEKKFLYPAAFQTFLSLTDEEKQSALRKEAVTHDREEEKERLKQRQEREEQHRQALELLKAEKKTTTRKRAPATKKPIAKAADGAAAKPKAKAKAAKPAAEAQSAKL